MSAGKVGWGEARRTLTFSRTFCCPVLEMTPHSISQIVVPHVNEEQMKAENARWHAQGQPQTQHLNSMTKPISLPIIVIKILGDGREIVMMAATLNASHALTHSSSEQP